MITDDKYCINATIPSDLYGLLIAQLFDVGMLGCEQQSVLDGIKAKIYFPNEESVRQALGKIRETVLIKKVRVSYLHSLKEPTQ
jgi:hypothetical protein